jgi:hypothetical protein
VNWSWQEAPWILDLNMSEQAKPKIAAASKTQNKGFQDGFQFHEFSGWLAALIPLTFLVLGVVEVSSYLWSPIAAVLYLVILGAGLFWLVGSGLSEEFATPGAEEMSTGFILVAAILVVVSFSQLGRYLNTWFGGFTANQSSYWHWMRFGIANTLEAVLFDVPAIYRWNISEITAISFWSQTLLFLFRTSLEFLVVVQIVRAIAFAKESWRNVSAGHSKHYLGFIFSDLGRLLVLAIWVIPLVISIGAIANDGLSLESTIGAFKYVLPIAFAIWFAWESLRALFLVIGMWNKVFALIGIGCGVWMLHENWPAFRLFMTF